MMFISLFTLASLFLSTVSAKDTVALKGTHSRRLGAAQNAEQCLEALYGFRFAYCDALREVITVQEWNAQAPQFFNDDIYTTGFGGPGVTIIWDGIDQFLDEATGLIPTLKSLATYQKCTITFGDNYNIKASTDNEITIVVPGIKATSSIGSRGPANIFEYEDDEVTCKKVQGSWKISSYDDPNSILVFDF